MKKIAFNLTFKKALMVAGLASSTLLIASCGGGEEKSVGVDPKVHADALFTVMNASRANYTKLIIGRLGPSGAGVITPKEEWKDLDDGAPLPAQMFRTNAESVREKTDDFTYSLQSLWPINKQNAPKSPMEKEGLKYVSDNPGENFYGTEELGGVSYYTAVYADVAVAAPCVDCHNDHKDTPRSDFKLGDVMGGVVIRVPL
ncbi:MAG: Tll0287-like domain-containing protein [Cellvibrionaceae bacterium]